MTWFKHTISALVLIYLSLMIYGLATVESEESGLIHSSIFALYTIFNFIVILTYRISLIGKTKINWVALGLMILLIISLFAMEGYKPRVHALWNYTIIGYILLCGEAIFQIIPKRKPLTLITKVSTIILLVFLIVMIVFQLGSPLFYFISEWLIIICSLLLIVNFFLKTKELT